MTAHLSIVNSHIIPLATHSTNQNVWGGGADMHIYFYFVILPSDFQVHSEVPPHKVGRHNYVCPCTIYISSNKTVSSLYVQRKGWLSRID